MRGKNMMWPLICGGADDAEGKAVDLVIDNCEINNSGDAAFESSLGAKFVADYTKKLGKINYKTNLSGFYSYKSVDYSNWTWINSFGYTLWKGIGVGFDFGLKQNKQEAFNDALNVDSVNYDENAILENVDNKMQSYWLFGLNYSF